MKMIYRLVLVVFLCLTLACSAALSKPDNLKEPENKCSFVFYSDHLSELYPKIENLVKPYKKDLEEEDGQLIVDTVSLLISDYIVKNKLCVTRKPLVQIFHLINDKNEAFVLKVKITFLDKEESLKDLVNTVIFTKKFVIYFGEYKKTGAGI